MKDLLACKTHQSASSEASSSASSVSRLQQLFQPPLHLQYPRQHHEHLQHHANLQYRQHLHQHHQHLRLHLLQHLHHLQHLRRRQSHLFSHTRQRNLTPKDTYERVPQMGRPSLDPRHPSQIHRGLRNPSKSSKNLSASNSESFQILQNPTHLPSPPSSLQENLPIPSCCLLYFIHSNWQIDLTVSL